MRKITKFTVFTAIVLATFSSCTEHEIVYATIDFEDVSLKGDTVLKDTSFTTKDMTFINEYNALYGSWSGFACSAKTDKITPGYTNDLSVYGTGGASGRKFCVIYNNATCNFSASHKENVIKSLAINNATYPYLSMKDGDTYAKKFATGDWFKVKIVGIDMYGYRTDSVEYLLADFTNSKTYICNQWTTVNLEKLGQVNKLVFSFSSTDNGAWGMNTPAYACIDDIKYVLPTEKE